MSRIPGRHAEYNQHTVAASGEFLRKLHRYSALYSTGLFGVAEDYSSMAFRMIHPRMKDPNRFVVTGYPTKLFQNLERVYLANSATLRQYHLATRTQVIHGDPNLSNILFDNSHHVTGILDFNDCRLGVVAEDLGVFIWDLCQSVSIDTIPALICTFLESYAHREADAAPVESRVAAIRYAIDRYLIINLHYLIAHQNNRNKLRRQEEQASRELRIVQELLKEVEMCS